MRGAPVWINVAVTQFFSCVARVVAARMRRDDILCKSRVRASHSLFRVSTLFRRRSRARECEAAWNRAHFACPDPGVIYVEIIERAN